MSKILVPLKQPTSQITPLHDNNLIYPLHKNNITSLHENDVTISKYTQFHKIIVNTSKIIPLHQHNISYHVHGIQLI